MKILVLDNYDSFTYNLVHIIKELGYGSHLDVHRNDKITVEEVSKYDKILLSPGPGIPEEAGNMMEIIKVYAPEKSMMGVCLGHQGIGESFGAKLHNMEHVLHGVANNVIVKNSRERLFLDLPDEFSACRYHSWTVVPDDLPDCLEITAEDENGLIMALAHKNYDVRGVQFHPESYITEYGKKMLTNWLKS